METWLEIAKRNRKDPANTQEAACLMMKTNNSQVPEAIRLPTTLERARSVESRRRLVSELSNKAILEYLGPFNHLQSITFSARHLNRAYDRFTSYDNSSKDQNAALPYLSWRRVKRRHALHRMRRYWRDSAHSAAQIIWDLMMDLKLKTKWQLFQRPIAAE